MYMRACMHFVYWGACVRSCDIAMLMAFRFHISTNNTCSLYCFSERTRIALQSSRMSNEATNHRSKINPGIDRNTPMQFT